MNNSIVCPAANNPYSNNPDARETSRSQEVHEGRIYTKLSYALTIHGRVIRIIQVIALAIFTCFIALAFRKTIQRLWGEGCKRLQDVAALIPEEISPLQEFKGLFVGIPEVRDVEKIVLSYVGARDLQALSITTHCNQEIAVSAMIKQLNNGDITLSDLRFKSINDVIGFFGTRCSEITRVDLRAFLGIGDQDVEKIVASFTKLHNLFFKNTGLTDQSVHYFAQLKHLKSLGLERCLLINDFSFLEHLPDLSNLDLSGCSGFEGGIGFLNLCPQIRTLNLSACEQIDDISILQECTEIEQLNISDCPKIHDLSPLQHCTKLISLIGLCLTRTSKGSDFLFLERCSKLDHLRIMREPRQRFDYDDDPIWDFSFLQYCPQITSLDFSRSRDIFNSWLKDISFVDFCPNLTSLNLSGCEPLKDITPLQSCTKLQTLNLSGCPKIYVESLGLESLGDYVKLKHLNLSNNFIKKIPFISKYKELVTLNLSNSSCDDFRPLLHCPKLKTVILSELSNPESHPTLDRLRARGMQIIL